MKTEVEMVREFMTAFGQRTPSTPCLPDGETQRLRWLLIAEEAKELGDANTMVDYLDAVGDLLYVVFGSAVAAGLSAEAVTAAFSEIHRSNMTKFWLPEEIETMPGNWTASPAGNGRFVVRDGTGKVRKSPSYQPVQLEDFTR
jgi:predicted HAD superfamily Cof-like phosphohydrolase